MTTPTPEHIRKVWKILQEREQARMTISAPRSHRAPEQIFYSVMNSLRNKKHNRYSNILAYDRTAVVVHDDGYLNANVVCDSKGGWWVAAQAPPPESQHSFFYAIYSQSASKQPSLLQAIPHIQVEKKGKHKSAIIVQLTGWEENGRPKADPYLPETSTSPIIFKPPKSSHLPRLALRRESVESSKELSTDISLLSLRPISPISSSSISNDKVGETNGRSISTSTDKLGAKNGLSTLTSNDKEGEQTGISTSSSTFGMGEEIRSPTTTSTTGKKVEEILIWHYHFHGWPDHGIPSGQGVKSLVKLIQTVREKRLQLGGDKCEVWVHCSAGVGRTGTFIVLSSLFSPPSSSAPSKPVFSPLGPLPSDIREDVVAFTVDSMREWRAQLGVIYDIYHSISSS
ncbi:hypothetical protein TREMEDRAFT_61835 [Tremella mesenterica DSM 1558]|uniref:uncharacterized protein n=1 Tax=Tremella mesenterica (strain ATCC 24925 / CBS 8224 / DSM 1558 / NBRC 9311 / NRRL Y-6157 / RJB 2259-6 / UBC 559-6) TaxID=578456 RepID=UPI0003F48C75|nr:uncharacterized protein TREMEDRAFT_61835 [Tremella mesenterica DSM 1558]EIW70073.1 hypothetical protein TREMEDRAFT_61835 [Tremella mesenterica DSM 1558]